MQSPLQMPKSSILGSLPIISILFSTHIENKGHAHHMLLYCTVISAVNIYTYEMMLMFMIAHIKIAIEHRKQGEYTVA